MKSLSEKHIRFIFYLLWLVSLSVQAFFTELLGDEAYYWMYSQELSWGYFDHPPMIALTIRVGYEIFQNEFGVRLFVILGSALTIYIWELIIKPKDLKTFYLLILSVGVLHFYGFLATPDSPLLLAASCFFLVYKEFIKNPTWKISLLLSVTIALMILSKYHGFIILALAILSNLRLLRSRYFWLSLIISLALLIPHIAWQIEYDFASLKYHLLERHIARDSLKNLFEYIITQPFQFGPFAGFIFIASYFLYKEKDPFSRTMKTSFLGGYVFFLILSLKSRIEPHWTLFIIVPSIYMAYHCLVRVARLRRILYFLFPVTLLLILTAKALMAFDFLPENRLIQKVIKPYHNKDLRAKAIFRQSDNLPVGFMNSYRSASLYEFYTGSEGFSLNNIEGRKNQFDIWNSEDRFRGEKIMLIYNYENRGVDSIPNLTPYTSYFILDNFQCYSKILVKPLNLPRKVNISDTIPITVKLENMDNDPVDFDSNEDFPSFIHYFFFEGKKVVKETRTLRISNEMLNTKQAIEIITPDKPGNYSLSFTIKTGWLPPTINSRRFNVQVD